MVQTTACEWLICLWLLWSFPASPFFVFPFTRRNWVICTNYPFHSLIPGIRAALLILSQGKWKGLTPEWEWMRLQRDLAVCATLRFSCRQPAHHAWDYGQQNKTLPSTLTIYLILSIRTKPRTVMTYKPVCKFLRVWHLSSLQSYTN